MLESLKKQNESGGKQEVVKKTILNINESILATTSEKQNQLYEPCNFCGNNLNPTQSLSCKHSFCATCAAQNLRPVCQTNRLPKCLLPYCYHVIDADELKKLSINEAFPSSLKKIGVSCIL